MSKALYFILSDHNYSTPNHKGSSCWETAGHAREVGVMRCSFQGLESKVVGFSGVLFSIWPHLELKLSPKKEMAIGIREVDRKQ